MYSKTQDTSCPPWCSHRGQPHDGHDTDCHVIRPAAGGELNTFAGILDEGALISNEGDRPQNAAAEPSVWIEGVTPCVDSGRGRSAQVELTPGEARTLREILAMTLESIGEPS